MESPKDSSLKFSVQALRNDAKASWDGLIRAVRPPLMLLLIEARMGTALRNELSSDDIWQETLILAWRDRETHIPQHPVPLLRLPQAKMQHIVQRRLERQRAFVADAKVFGYIGKLNGGRHAMLSTTSDRGRSSTLTSTRPEALL